MIAFLNEKSVIKFKISDLNKLKMDYKSTKFPDSF